MARLDKMPPQGRVYRFRRLLFWAQGGCICLEDTANDGNYNVIKREEFAARVVNLKMSVDKGHFDQYADERNEVINFVINGCAAIKEGKHQGDPFDPRVLADKLAANHISKGYIYLGDGSRVTVPNAAPPANPPGKLFIAGPGQKVTLRTHSQSEVPDRAADLPAFGPPADPSKRMPEPSLSIATP